MNEVVPVTSHSLEKQSLFSEACRTYCDLYDETTQPPTIKELRERLKGKYLPTDLDTLDSPEFGEALKAARKERLINTMVPRLLAAEMGTRMGRKAAQETLRRLDDEPEGMRQSDLNMLMKIGFEFAAKVDKDVEEATGSSDVQVNVEFKDLLLSLPPDRAMAVTQELVRRITKSGT